MVGRETIPPSFLLTSARGTHTRNQPINVKRFLREINSGSKYENLVDVAEISGSTAATLGSTTEICIGWSYVAGSPQEVGIHPAVKQ